MLVNPGCFISILIVSTRLFHFTRSFQLLLVFFFIVQLSFLWSSPTLLYFKSLSCQAIKVLSGYLALERNIVRALWFSEHCTRHRASVKSYRLAGWRIFSSVDKHSSEQGLFIVRIQTSCVLIMYFFYKFLYFM